MRIGEACALEWKDIDFDNNFINIYKTLNRTKVYYDNEGNKIKEPKDKVMITTPKKKASYRSIPMTNGVVEAFKSWKLKQMQDKKKAGRNLGNGNDLLNQYPDLVFTSSNGNCYLPTSALQECYRITAIVNEKEKKWLKKKNVYLKC